MKLNQGIYMIKNIVNEKVYIGSSTNIRKRLYSHKRYLKLNIHHSDHLQRSWNKYGEENFIFSVIELVEDINTLISREQYWIDKLNSYNYRYGYNMLPTAGSTLGFKMSEESKKKMSIARKGRKVSEEEVRKRSGEKHYKSKLTEEDVEIIKELLTKSNITQSEIAKRFNISTSVVSKIKKNQIWKHTNSSDIYIYNTKKKSSNATSIYKGVTARLSSKGVVSYRVAINIMGKMTLLGEYSDELASANVYNHKARELFGNNAWVNDIPYMSIEECEKYKKTQNPKSGYHGVLWDKRINKWFAKFDNKHLGSNEDIEYCIKLYNKEAINKYGINYKYLNKDKSGNVIL